ncbi:MAG TPA: pyridoxal-phosphate dependent enzyme [Candidatus Limnocylindria bacterium]|jgi:threonine dehydratase|nr:pyridoxal-phosphate dependent enzyme [Candidatus Limnocylindria bacterium]
MARFPNVADVLAAAQRLRGVAVRTPLEPSAALAEESGAAEVRMKLELLQPTGAFKLRGAENKVALLAEADANQRLVAASTGNHGIAVAAAAARHGMRLTVLVPASVSPAKLERLRALESDTILIEVFGRDPDDVENEARRRDDEDIATYVAPYNDADVVAGAATVGLEIMEDWPDCDAIVVPVGGAGLISGIGLWAKAMRPGLRLVGVQPAASPPLYAYFESGSQKPMPIAPTLADGVAGNIERGSITWKMARQLVDEVVVVDEEQIADGMRWAADAHHLLLEGSAALGIAALRARLGALDGRHVAVVLSGRNVDTQTLRAVLDR